MGIKKFNEFGPSSWAIENKTTVFLITIVITLAGLGSYWLLPKENFPEIAWPVIYVATPYPGTAPADVENLVTRKIEKELKGIDGVKKINSTSIQDFSSVFVEFETDVDLEIALRDVEKAVDRAKSELPNDLPADPEVLDINLSEIPIMFIQVSGNFDNATLKRYAEDIKDKLESFQEIKRVDIVGAPEREIQIFVDLYKMELANLSMGDVEQAIGSENVTISGGELDIADQKVGVRVNGELKTIQDIENIVVRGSRGNSAYLRDFAEIKDAFKEKNSVARLDGKAVLTLNVIKNAGENLVDASDKIQVALKDLKETRFPENLDLIVSADQSELTRSTLDELVNTIILGFILVTVVLTFFMGVRDAMFVGLSVPLSSFIAFALLPGLGFTLNLVVLFSFILALGIVVDNSIVVVENTYRIFHDEDLPIRVAAKKAAGQVIAPVFSGTLTTVVPFLPLLVWKGAVGEFMGFLPVVMIITLMASIFVAYVINPVFAVAFMKKEHAEKTTNHRQILIYSGIMVALGIIFHLAGVPALGNFLFFMVIFTVLNAYVIKHAVRAFQEGFLVRMKRAYRNTLQWAMGGWRPYGLLVGVIVLGIVVFGAFGAATQSGWVKVVQFPKTEPNFVYVYNEMPNGTRLEVTDSVMRILEDRVYGVIGKDNPIVASVVTNVAIGAGDANSFGANTAQPHKGKITVEFVKSKERGKESTAEYLQKIREAVKGIPGARITAEQDAGGPPGSADLEILIKSEDFTPLMDVSTRLFAYLDSINVDGIEKLKWDVDEKRPEILIRVNREKARELGLSTAQVGLGIRTALFGKEITKFRDNEDDYEVNLRLDEKYRSDITSLLNMRVSFMDPSSGMFKSVPISSVADLEYTFAYGGINRTDLEKSVKITSNVLGSYDVNAVNAEVTYWVDEFAKTNGMDKRVSVEVGGATKDQQEEGAFLAGAFGVAILLIFMILVVQFNSLGNVMIVMSQIVLSIIGVFLGLTVTGQDFSVILSGVGLITLSGLVVNNGIILLDFMEKLRLEGVELKEAIIEGGSTRLTPVLLTAAAAVLGLIPLGLAVNINFGTLLSDLNPQIFVGGDSAAFWGPFSWTMIYGIVFATGITLIIVPVIYFIKEDLKGKIRKRLGKPELPEKYNRPYMESEDEEVVTAGSY